MSNITKRSWTLLTDCLTVKEIRNVFTDGKVNLKNQHVKTLIYKAKISLSFNS